MAMAQPKAQAPFIPGQKEPADLVDEQQDAASGNRSSSPKSSNTIARKFISFFGNSSDGKSTNDGDGDAGREKQQGDYYAPVHTEVVQKDSNPKSGAEMTDMYSPGAGVDIVTSDHQPRDQPGDQQGEQQGGQQKTPTTREIGEGEQRGEGNGPTVMSGAGLVEAGKGMASDVSESLVSIRAHVMEKLSGLQLPSESLDAVKRTFEGAVTTTKDAVQRTKQSLLDILPASLSSSSADQARQVVEDMEKEMLANSEGSGEDLSQISEGPKISNSAAASSTSESTPTFMRAKL